MADTDYTELDELGKPLLRFLTRKVGNSEDASDIAQEAFLRMHKYRQEADLTNARAFLFRTANNLAVDYFRHEKVHDRYMATEMLPHEFTEDDAAPSAEREVSAEEELARISDILEQLPDKARKAFLLHRNAEMSYPQIAQEMGVSTSMVEKYIIQALKLIREQLR